MYKSTGKFIYIVDNSLIKVNIEVDPSIVNYYRNLVPKYINLNKTKYTPHITVIRNELINNYDILNKYNNKEIEFYYDGIVRNDNVYYWLRAFSVELSYIRYELGLKIYDDIAMAPDRFPSFHITIGNLK
jgi:hypothetical protein